MSSGTFIAAHELPLYLQGTHRGRPPWPSIARIRALIWLALSLCFLLAVMT